MSMSESSDDQASHTPFGSLLPISEDSVVRLASTIRQRISGRLPSLKDHLAILLNGGYKLIYILQFYDEVKHVIRVPAVGWGNWWTEHASNAFKSQDFTMRYKR
jgi:hypothetical protein